MRPVDDWEKTDAPFERGAALARRALLLSLLALVVFTVLASLERWRVQKEADGAMARAQHAQQLVDRVRLLDERLTLSAHLAAATGDPAWARQYRQQVQPMDAALAQVLQLADAPSAERFRAETTAANDRLLALEDQALQAASRGQLLAARALLDGADYQRHKRQLLDGTDRFLESVEQQMAAQRIAQVQRAGLLFGAAVAAALLGSLWMGKLLSKRLTEAQAAHRHVHAQLRELAQFDPLTGLANRHSLHQRLNATLAHVRRTPGSFHALLLIDLDGFKPINDQHGHAAGDAMLVHVATQLKAVVRADEMVARLGGDEFVVLTHELDDFGGLESLADRLLLAVRLPLQLREGLSVEVDASVGIALMPADGDSAEQLLARADAALYRVKQSGKGRVGWPERSAPPGLTGAVA